MVCAAGARERRTGGTLRIGVANFATAVAADPATRQVFKPGPHGTALITGKPARSGRHLIVVIAKNSAGQSGQTLLIVVRK
jgi:hypothetical protein